MQAGEAIIGHFAMRIKVSNLPELCLFADVSEEKVPIYSMLLNVLEAGHARSVSRRRGFDPHVWHIISCRFGHEKI